MKSLLDQAGPLDRATKEDRTQVRSNCSSIIFHLDIWILVDMEAKKLMKPDKWRQRIEARVREWRTEKINRGRVVNIS